MKNFIISCLFLLGICSQNCFGQLKVTSSGHVGVASNLAESVLSVGGNGTSNFTAQFAPVTGRKAASIHNVSYTTDFPLGLYIENDLYNTNKTIWGIRVHSTHTNANGLTSGTYYGVVSNGGGSYNKNIGIMGGLEDSSSLGTSNAGIYGSSSTSDYFQYSGTYAGYFNGDVRITGATYSTLLSPSPVSSSTTAMALDENQRGTSTIEKLSLITPIVVTGEEETVAPLSDDYVQMAESLGEKVPEDVQPVQTRMPSVRYSIDEESLREAYPELVYEDKDGHVSINYVEMVPLLVQSIKELKQQVDELQQYKASERQTRSVSWEDEIPQPALSPALQGCVLYQNRPNPFSESTTIRFTLPEEAPQAYIYIFNMSGNMLKQIPVESGMQSVTISGGEFPAGIYLYSLVVGGKEIDTKKMILSK